MVVSFRLILNFMSGEDVHIFDKECWISKIIDAISRFFIFVRSSIRAFVPQKLPIPFALVLATGLAVPFNILLRAIQFKFNDYGKKHFAPHRMDRLNELQ